MTNMTSDAAREASRETDGKFGTQEHARPERGLAATKISQMRDRLGVLRTERDLLIARAHVVEDGLLVAEVRDAFPHVDYVEFSINRQFAGDPYYIVQGESMGNRVEQATHTEEEPTGELSDIIEQTISMEHREHLFRAAYHQTAMNDPDELDLRLDMADATWYVPAGLDSGKAADVWVPLLYTD